MWVFLCITLCALGHMIRDGWPATGNTQIARVFGGICCTSGAFCIFPTWIGIILGLAVFVGFWTDQKHGEGQGGTTWRDVMFLTLSGTTSLLPLAIAAAILLNPIYILAFLPGVLKVPIWFGWWRFNPMSYWTWLQPTRMAAITFGALVGALIAYI